MQQRKHSAHSLFLHDPNQWSLSVTWAQGRRRGQKRELIVFEVFDDDTNRSL